MFRRIAGVHIGGAVMIGLVSLMASDTRAQIGNALTGQDRAAALNVENAHRNVRRAEDPASVVPGLRSTPAGQAGKSVVTSVVPMGSTAPDPTGRRAAATGEMSVRRAMVTRFDYATGATIRTTVNLENNAVIDEQRDVNYPTPLAPEELEEAKALLIAVPDVRAVLGSTDPSRAKFLHVVPVATDPSAPGYGHRRVTIWLDRPKSSSKYLVDLTTRTAEKLK